MLQSVMGANVKSNIRVTQFPTGKYPWWFCLYQKLEAPNKKLAHSGGKKKRGFLEAVRPSV